MAITVADLKFFQSERMTDEDDGGGQMTATEIVSGTDNQIFDDISDVDRAAGDVSIRKVYAAVTSADTSKYLDAGVTVFAAPADPNVSVLLASTGSFYDERSEIETYIESYLVQGPKFMGILYEQQVAGSRAITFQCKPEDEAPGVNTALLLIEWVSTDYTTESYRQFVRIARILSNSVQSFTTQDSDTFQRRVISCELTAPLDYTFHGYAISKFDDVKPLGVMYSCVVADTARYYGIQAFTAPASPGDLSVYVDAIYSRLVPTSQIETPVLDFTAAAERALIYPASATSLTFSLGDTFSANFSLSVGRPIVPGSLIISVTGGTLRDENGALVSGVTEIGTVTYATGHIEFAATSPTYSGLKTISFTPGGSLTRPTNTFGLPVTENTRYRTYVTTLAPIPQRATLMVDFLSQGNWYRLQENGNGILQGAAESYGAGTVNFDTGSVSVTLGALPDVNSSILFAWASGTDVLATPETVALTFGVAAGVAALKPTTLTLTHGDITLADQGDGTLTGTGGSATVDYRTGALTVTLDTLPNKNAALALTGDRYIDADYRSGGSVLTAINGVIESSTPTGNIVPGSLRLRYDLRGRSLDYYWFYYLGVAVDDGVGGWVGHDGTINYTTGEFTLDTTSAIPASQWLAYSYGYSWLYSWYFLGGSWTPVYIPRIYPYQWGVAVDPLLAAMDTTAYCSFSYLTGTTTTPVDEAIAVTSLSANLKKQPGTSLVPDSLRFTLGDLGYYDINGAIYHTFDPVTGQGTAAGVVDSTSGQVEITDWADASSNNLVIQARVERLAFTPSTFATFRTPAAPVAVGSFSFRVTLGDQTTALEGSADTDGVISGAVTDPRYGDTTSAYGRLDYQTGVVTLFFGRWVTASSYVSAPWYHEDAVNDAGEILMPRTALLDTLRYDCVTYTSLPLDTRIIGLDPVQLPSDGQVTVFRDGQLALAHHTDTHSENSLSPTQSVDMGRVRLYRVTIEDAAGQRLPASFYSVDRATGIVTMASDLNLTGYSGPYVFSHTVADLTVIADADLSGRITLAKALSHDYPADESRLSGVLYTGTLQARVSAVFAQSTWDSVWSDELRGSAPLAQYNDTLYPILVTNGGAYSDRILVKFTGSTAFQVIGEKLGFIATGTINEDCTPINSLTGNPYFTLQYEGWGGGWSTGNCLRFNLIGANYPVDLIRAIQPSEPTGQDDSVELLFLGNVDA